MVMSRKLLVAIICAIISQPRNGVWSVRGWEDSCEVPFRPTHLFSAPIDDVVLFIGTRCEINGSVGFSFDAFGCYFSASRSSSQKKVLMCKATLNYYSCFGFEKRMEHVVGGSEPHLGHLNSVLKTKIFRHTQIAVSLMTTRHPSRVSDRPFCLSLSVGILNPVHHLWSDNRNVSVGFAYIIHCASRRLDSFTGPWPSESRHFTTLFHALWMNQQVGEIVLES